MNENKMSVTDLELAKLLYPDFAKCSTFQLQLVIYHFEKMLSFIDFDELPLFASCIILGVKYAIYLLNKRGFF